MIRTEYCDNKWIFPYVAYQSDSTKRKLPLIVQLHGAGERGNGNADLFKVDVFGFSNVIKDDVAHECMVVMPQCPPDSFWAGKVESLLDFIEQLKREFPIDEDRVYLTGLSMGGFGTWYAAMAKPEIFAAIAPVCGGGMAWNANVLTMPVWAFHGTDDDVVSVFHSDNMVEKMREYGLDVRYSRMDGVGHNVWDEAYGLALLDWLLSKKR